jgi:uncharacterized protein (DUF1697 family)
MTRWFAFLRGINVGGHNVKMDALRAYFEALGFVNVSTFIASGNVVFEAESDSAADLERQIEAKLASELGFGAAVFLRSAAELRAIAADSPFTAEELAGALVVYVVMLAEPASDAERGRVVALSSDQDLLRVVGREIYWLCRGKMSDSPIFIKGLLDKALRRPTTSRNMNTIQRLLAKYCNPA